MLVLSYKRHSKSESICDYNRSWLFFPQVSITRSLQFAQISSRVMPTMDILRSWYCNRGILVRYNSLNLTEINKCLCSPNYFGSRCQWQNQGISLNLKLIAHSVTSVNVLIGKCILFHAIIHSFS